MFYKKESFSMQYADSPSNTAWAGAMPRLGGMPLSVAGRDNVKAVPQDWVPVWLSVKKTSGKVPFGLKQGKVAACCERYALFFLFFISYVLWQTYTEYTCTRITNM
jgi:hypothetical protein